MAKADVPLSVANITKLVKNLTQLAEDLRDAIPTKIEVSTCELLADEIRSNIAGIQDLDGNYLGAENPNASVNVFPTVWGHEANWEGRQIAYLEFGTGATGAAGAYPGKAMPLAGYSPDPTKEHWVYKDAKSDLPVVSHGIPPYAPMYHASLLLRSHVLLNPAQEILKGAVARAVTL